MLIALLSAESMTNRSKMVNEKNVQISSLVQFPSIKLLDLDDTEMNETRFCLPRIGSLIGKRGINK